MPLGSRITVPMGRPSADGRRYARFLEGDKFGNLAGVAGGSAAASGVLVDALGAPLAGSAGQIVTASGVLSGRDGGTQIVFDPFTSGGLGHTENGFVWLGSTNAAVVSSKLEITYPAGVAMAEQKFSLGATQRRELIIGFDCTIPSNYNHQTGNNKALFTLWSNSTGSSANNDGYGATASTEALIGLEFNPNPNGDGGSAFALRVQAGEGGVTTLDYNASDTSLWPNAIAVGDRNQTRRYVARIKASTYRATDPGTGQGPFWWPSDGAVQVWKDGELIMSRLNANLYKEDWDGMNRGYLFGAANGAFAQSTKLIIDNFYIGYI